MTKQKDECPHVSILRAFLKGHGLEVYSEHGEDGWVNVRCSQCRRTHEIILDSRREEGGDDE